MRFARCAVTKAFTSCPWPRQEIVQRVDLAAVRVLVLLRVRYPARDEEVPELLQAALFAPRRLFRRAGIVDRKRDVGPVERRKAKPRLLAVRDGERPERAAVKRAFERDDEPAVAVGRGHHAIHQHGFDRVLDRLGARVDDEMTRRADRRDAVQLRLEPQRQHGLVFRVRVALDDERQRIEHGPDHGRIVLAVGVGGDERAHVEEPVRFARLVAVDHPEIRSDRLARIERHGQRKEQAARGGLEGAVGRRKEARDQCLERLLRRRAAVPGRARGCSPARYRASSCVVRSRNAAARSRPVAVSSIVPPS